MSSFGHGHAKSRMHVLYYQRYGLRYARLLDHYIRIRAHADHYPSICAFLQQTLRMFFAFRWKQAPQHPRTACSRRISPLTAVLLRGIALRNGSAYLLSNLIAAELT